MKKIISGLIILLIISAVAAYNDSTLYRDGFNLNPSGHDINLFNRSIHNGTFDGVFVNVTSGTNWSYANNTFLKLSGDTMTGQLNISNYGLRYGNLSISSNLTTSDYIIGSNYNNAMGNSIVVSGSDVYNRGVLKGVRSRGTLVSPSVPVTNDYVFSILGVIYDSKETQGTAAVDFYVDGIVSTGIAPQRISFSTSLSNGASRVERLKIKSNGDIIIPGISGTGNAYTCIDSAGKLYRGNPTC